MPMNTFKCNHLTPVHFKKNCTQKQHSLTHFILRSSCLSSFSTMLPQSHDCIIISSLSSTAIPATCNYNCITMCLSDSTHMVSQKELCSKNSQNTHTHTHFETCQMTTAATAPHDHEITTASASQTLSVISSQHA